MSPASPHPVPGSPRAQHGESAGVGYHVPGGFSEIAPTIDLLICDVWGVVHNGVAAHLGACQALTRFRADGGVVIMLSNSPRVSPAVIAQMQELGVPQTAFDDVVTSGDLTRQLLAEHAGASIFHIGTPREQAVMNGLDLHLADPDAADLCLCTGLRDDTRETEADYADLLERLAARSLTMICGNPDLVVERGPRLLPCAGALARAYEALGGSVVYAGKPHAPAYHMALAKGAEKLGSWPDLARVAAVGDAIRTDIAGASGQGLRSLLLLDGIHWHDVGGDAWQQNLAPWLAQQAVRPTFVMPRLIW